jgi:hypothetical protein
MVSIGSFGPGLHSGGVYLSSGGLFLAVFDTLVESCDFEKKMNFCRGGGRGCLRSRWGCWVGGRVIFEPEFGSFGVF